MRTTTNNASTNRNVFGFGQDRVVSLSTGLCAHAAQHLASWHASKRTRDSYRALTRRVTAVVAGAVPAFEPMCSAITGPQRQPVRLASPVLVMV